MKFILVFFLVTINSISKGQQACATIIVPQLSDDTRKLYEQKLDEARSRLSTDSLDAEYIIWYGRRTAYLGRYIEAIDIYTKGLALHPGNRRNGRPEELHMLVHRLLQNPLLVAMRAEALGGIL